MIQIKKLYILIFGFVLLLIVPSCYKDDSTLGTMPPPDPQIAGLNTMYNVYTRQDTLRITPTVDEEDRYAFSWSIYSTNFNVIGGILPTPDTLALTKDLNYVVDKDPGEYILLFNVQDRQTAVTKITRVNLSISTLTMTGWYLLKDDGERTDFDFIHPNGRIDNWMAFFNNGRNLAGRPIKSIFSGNFKTSLTSTDLFGVLVAISDQDAGIFRIDNGEMIMDFSTMFFQTPATRNLQDVFQQMADNSLSLNNGNRIYTMIKGALFANPQASTYKIAPVSAVGASSILFDENSSSVMLITSASYSVLQSNGNDLKNMDADVLWMAGYPSQRNVAAALFKKRDTDEGLLVRINAAYGFLAGYSSPLIQFSRTVPLSHGVMSADIICGNYDADYLYYAQGNRIYMTDFAALQESLQIELPEGEEITCMQHIKFPQPAAGVVNTVDYIAIASYANGKYKVWLHSINSIGGLQPVSQPHFEGDGRVSCINYMENGTGSRVF